MDIRQPLSHMYDLLSREELLLATQISEERNALRRAVLGQELKNVRGVLAEITAQFSDSVSDDLRKELHLPNALPSPFLRCSPV